MVQNNVTAALRPPVSENSLFQTPLFGMSQFQVLFKAGNKLRMLMGSWVPGSRKNGPVLGNLLPEVIPEMTAS